MTSLQQTDSFERLNDSVMTRTVKGIIKFWNRRAEVLYGWRKEEAVGRVSHDLLRTQFPQPLEEIESELVSSGRWEGKLVHSTRDGGRVTVRSRWTLDPSGQPGEVTEINVLCADYEIDRGGDGGSSCPEVGKHTIGACVAKSYAASSPRSSWSVLP
jgi:PAS domain S-box-containing protein